MTTTTAQGASPTDDASGRTRGAGALDRRWAALGAVITVAVIHLSPAVGLPAGALDADLGIQYFLGGETARGAVPLVDFEHTWNVASWWFNALLFRLADGDPSMWLYLWGRVFGPALAAVTAVGVLWRLRLRAEWVLVGAGAWLALSHVIHSKYAIPVLWAFALVPTGRSTRTRRDVVARALLAGLTALAHVELAVLLGAGVVMFDLVGRDGDGLPLRRRALTAAAVPLGAAAAIGLELAAYAAIGQPPGEVLRQLLANPAETAEGFTYGYPLLSAVSLRPKLLAPSVLIAFVPAIWLRLQPATRLVACLHLAQALIAIRRPDPAHVDAATTLLGLLAVLVVHDVVTDPRGRGRFAVRRPWTTALPLAAAGAGAMALAVAVGFHVDSLLAIGLLAGVLSALVVVTTRTPAAQPAVSVGAAAAVAALLVGAVAGGVATSLRSGDALAPTDQLAAEVAEPLDRCTDGDRTAWLVPGPLPLYTALDMTNPTPYTVFWYGFQAEHDRVRAALADGRIPAIVQVGPAWPTSFGDLPRAVDAAMSPCAELMGPAGQPITIWRAD